ncbi:lipopolysaccharide assembly protein LapA domain-containing protein [Brachybacterium sp. UNK5269]|uniref:LapA family protein n=1 Tax=Brachybacterium sp. UNK5269 TaxID=3408576 RepID=UPI003BB14363
MTASDDPTRPTGSPTADAPLTGAPGPAPQRPADPTTGRRAAERPSAPSPAEQTSEPATEPATGGGKTAGLWIALILGAIVLVLLLIFVIQNDQSARFMYFSAEFDLPLGVAMLLAAIAGALVMALVGSVRMIQMHWTIRRLRKAQEKIHRATR